YDIRISLHPVHSSALQRAETAIPLPAPCLVSSCPAAGHVISSVSFVIVLA
ncbi:hypothetical protein V8C34DRAFT_276923, partial [Trichoderma compactum]